MTKPPPASAGSRDCEMNMDSPKSPTRGSFRMDGSVISQKITGPPKSSSEESLGRRLSMGTWLAAMSIKPDIGELSFWQWTTLPIVTRSNLRDLK